MRLKPSQELKQESDLCDATSSQKQFIQVNSKVGEVLVRVRLLLNPIVWKGRGKAIMDDIKLSMQENKEKV